MWQVRINFGLNYRRVQSQVSVICLAVIETKLSDRWVQTKKSTSPFADLWFQSVFWTQRWSQQRTNPKSKINGMEI